MDDSFEAHRQKPVSGFSALVAASAADLERIVLEVFHGEERRRAETHSQTSHNDIEEIIEILLGCPELGAMWVIDFDELFSQV